MRAHWSRRSRRLRYREGLCMGSRKRTMQSKKDSVEDVVVRELQSEEGAAVGGAVVE